MCMQEVEAVGHRGATATGSKPRMHPSICMSSIDNCHVGTATDVQWLSSVTFSKEGATAQQVTFISIVTCITNGHVLSFCEAQP